MTKDEIEAVMRKLPDVNAYPYPVYVMSVVIDRDVFFGFQRTEILRFRKVRHVVDAYGVVTELRWELEAGPDKEGVL